MLCLGTQHRSEGETGSGQIMSDNFYEVGGGVGVALCLFSSVLVLFCACFFWSILVRRGMGDSGACFTLRSKGCTKITRRSGDCFV